MCISRLNAHPPGTKETRLPTIFLGSNPSQRRAEPPLARPALWASHRRDQLKAPHRATWPDITLPQHTSASGACLPIPRSCREAPGSLPPKLFTNPNPPRQISAFTYRKKQSPRTPRTLPRVVALHVALVSACGMKIQKGDSAERLCLPYAQLPMVYPHAR